MELFSAENEKSVKFFCENVVSLFFIISVRDLLINMENNEANQEAESPAMWELTNQLSQYLDRHLVIPLLEFHTVNGMYDEVDLSKGKLDLLAHTSMVDFYIEEFKKLYPDQEVPEEMQDKRRAVVGEFRRLQEETKPLLDIFSKPEVTSQVILDISKRI